MTTSLTLVRRFKARPSIVFDAMTTPEGIAHWWGPDDGPVLHDSLDEASHRHAHSVSADLKFSLREAVEVLANAYVTHCRASKRMKRATIAAGRSNNSDEHSETKKARVSTQRKRPAEMMRLAHQPKKVLATNSGMTNTR